MQGLSVTALEIFSVFGVTAIAAAIFPFSKRSKSIWESSPYRKWKIFGIPVVTLGAVVNLAYLAILAVFFFFQADQAWKGFTFATGMLILGDLGAGPLLVLVLELEGQADGRHQHRDAHRRVAA